MPVYLTQNYCGKQNITVTIDTKRDLNSGMASYAAKSFSAHPEVGCKVGEGYSLKVFRPC